MSAPSSNLRQVGRGTVAGVAAFVLGYFLTYLLAESRVRESLEGINAVLQFFGGEQIPAWQAVGWLFFNMHYVRTHLPGVGGPRTQNFVSSLDFSALLYAIPVVVLLATGFVLAWSRGPVDLRHCAARGATVVVGYAGAAIVGLFVFGVTRGDASISPDPVTGVLLAGILYPVVLGAGGGVLAGVIRSAERGTEGTTAD